MDEMEQLPAFADALKKQEYRNFELVACVNQPEEWWSNDVKKTICLSNARCIHFLEFIREFPVRMIDRSSKGHGWIGKKHGVGWARKTAMDEIIERAEKNDLILSVDADTTFSEGYLNSLVRNFEKNPSSVALSVPYYHRLTGNPDADRAILRYELYMRYFAINLWRIRSPYSFTAMGSAMALPAWAYQKVSGLTPLLSGEDFYFLQKLVKAGYVLTWNEQKVFPAARFSDRVYFGTGPAMIKGRGGDWQSYPIYHFSLVDLIGETYRIFPQLYTKNLVTPMDSFLKTMFREENIWAPLRRNNRSKERFVKACHEKIDGLRILQFLKANQKLIEKSDETCLFEFLKEFYPDELTGLKLDLSTTSFETLSIVELDRIRNFLAGVEEDYQKQNWLKNLKDK
jgi:hypothetical protein